MVDLGIHQHDADDAGAAAAEVQKLLGDETALQTMRSAAFGFSQKHCGATARTVALIGEITPQRTAD